MCHDKRRCPLLTGMVFNIQRFCIDDGPGIRTLVFMKGCPLNCIWCHNPESKKMSREIFYLAEKCVGCKMCETVCPADCHKFENNIHFFDRRNCTACSKCVTACMNGALETVGYEVTPENVMKEILKDKAYYENSNGGMTLSGGEPMYQFEFTSELLKMAKQNSIHTCMETCGFATEQQYKSVAEYTDIFLYDYKETDPQLHKKYTGVTNELILSNLHMLENMGKQIILRCPIIPGLNDRKEHFEGIANIANNLKNILEINIEPYHPLGKNKAERLGEKYKLYTDEFVDQLMVDEWIDFISKKTDALIKKA